MEDYHVAEFVHMQKKELGLFAIYDGHRGDTVPSYLQKHLFSNILKEVVTFEFQSIMYASLIIILNGKITILYFFYGRKNFGITLRRLYPKHIRAQIRRFFHIVLSWGMADQQL